MRPTSRALSTALPVLLLGLILSTVLVAVGAPERATISADDLRPVFHGPGSTYLCNGYAGCKAKGMGNAGYAKNNGTMYWQMYSGHNCTNYAAYRMVKRGMPNKRPWTGGGNAEYWGLKMRSITDQIPNVGAIAWWAAGDNGASSSGHVAYVERVVDANTIVVSEDAWGGDFDWRQITRASGRWPSGFIHFVDKRIENTARPTVTGTAQVGVPMRAGPGAWNPQPTGLSYQWLANGDPIPGAVGATFTPTAAQRGQYIRVRVTATKPDHTPAVAQSLRTAPVAAGRFAVTKKPAIAGNAFVGQTLTLVPGTFSPAPDAVRYQWRLAGEPVAGATGTTFAVTAAMLGKQIQVRQVTSKAGYVDGESFSPQTAPVTYGNIRVTAPFTVSGKAKVGQTLTANRGTFAPADASVSYQWLHDGQAIPGATGSTYQVRAEDARDRIALRVTLTRAGYTTTYYRVRIPGKVTTPSHVKVRATGGDPGAAKIVVKVHAPGIDDVWGKVRIRVAGEERTVRLEDGKVRITIDDLPRGGAWVKARFLGSTIVTRSHGRDGVHIS